MHRIVESWGDEKSAGVVREDGARARVWFHEAQHVWERDEWRAEAGASASEVRQVELHDAYQRDLWRHGADECLHNLTPVDFVDEDFVDVLIEAAPHGTTDRAKWVRDRVEPRPKVTDMVSDALERAVEASFEETKRSCEATSLQAADPAQWWHKLEVGDVFGYLGYGRAVTEVPSDKQGVWAGGFWFRFNSDEVWAKCTPPLHLDPEWHKRAPVGTKLVDEDGHVWTVRYVGKPAWTLRRRGTREEYEAGTVLAHWLERSFLGYPERMRPLSPRELRELEAWP